MYAYWDSKDQLSVLDGTLNKVFFFFFFFLCWDFTAQSTTRSCRAGQLIVVLFLGRLRLSFVCLEVLRPCQQLRSCRVGQLPINTVPGQA